VRICMYMDITCRFGEDDVCLCLGVEGKKEERTNRNRTRDRERGEL